VTSIGFIAIHTGRYYTNYKNKDNTMPTIANFQGLAIYIYMERDAPHRLPHFHVYYGEYRDDVPQTLSGNKFSNYR
jgi:hypothetical protein